MRKIAIIGASYLQLPLIRKAKSMGLETHVFAWECGDVGEKEADVFYPISIVEKERILEECRKIGIDGICSIASDLAVLTVCYVAQNMGLVSNSIESSLSSVNKYSMKKAFMAGNVPAAVCRLVEDGVIPDVSDMGYPLIVKPTDRSGSRGVTRLNSADDDIKEAVVRAIEQSLEKRALIEEYVYGDEYSVECISYEGKHTLLAVTKKYTTGDPHYIETGHIEPSDLSDMQIEKVRQIVFNGLDALQVKYGASHSELKVNGDDIKVIEIGARMGGDMIGSTLVQLSTGYDFIKAVIDVCLGDKPEEFTGSINRAAAIRYITDDAAEDCLKTIRSGYPDVLYEVDDRRGDLSSIIDSSTRKGYYIMASSDRDLIAGFMPESE
ncbi:MAG: ATP-grasp domain-containing protein [Clostridiales bacterium]|nr:ATP-grasp domain-containing protein [Clostridiales bacterium]